MKYIKQKVRAGRSALGWSQKRLAIAAGVSLPTVARFERGANSSIVTYEKIINGLSECEFSDVDGGFIMKFTK